MIAKFRLLCSNILNNKKRTQKLKLVVRQNQINMEPQAAIKIFEEKKVRTLWDDTKEQWYFSIVDVVEVLTNSPNPRKYWSVLKT